MKIFDFLTMIYFDNASTTRVTPEAAQAAVNAMCEGFGNPSSLHGLGFSAEKLVRDSKIKVAREEIEALKDIEG